MPPPPTPPFVVLPLAERPQFVELVAAWGFAEWGHLAPGRTLAQRVERVRAGLDPSRVPVVFVALDAAGRPAGTAQLMFDDIEGDPRNPWLASVYVPPEARGRGVAKLLVRAAEDAARRLGYARLHLFTASAPALYAGLGWQARETRDYRGEEIVVMEKDL
ncbi:MAG: GNAT family N-acetyltransferase [Alphaproteobacteria bacterium]|nr:GNAT family N-acetyltransferase [Alphaproteobacteria bacterium]